MRLLSLLFLILVTGCPPKDPVGTTDSGTEGGSSSEPTTSTTSTTTTTTTTTDPSGTMGASQTMGETTDLTGVGPGTTSDVSTSNTDNTGGSSPGGGGGDIPGACMGVCEKGINECMIMEFGPDVGLCTQGCAGDLGMAMGACAEAIVAYLGCLGGLDCMALTDAIVNDNPGPCLDAAIATEMACGGGGECITSAGGNPDMTECNLTIECPMQPVQEMQCIGKQCTCLVDGMKVGMCQSMDICMTPDQLEMKATDCCGF